MKIAGLNKLTALDFPNEIASIVFFAGCNFRCPFCHNSQIAEGEVNQIITEEEVLNFLAKRRGVLGGVVLSGGEPLINDLEKLVPFIKSIRALGFKIKLDTNGSYPQKLKKILDLGLLDYIAMDIKGSPKNYALCAGVPVNLDDIIKSVNIIKNSGLDYEFRSTLVKELHTASDLEQMAQWMEGEKNYFLQCFVNTGGLFNNSLSPFDLNLAKDIVATRAPNVKTR